MVIRKVFHALHDSRRYTYRSYTIPHNAGPAARRAAAPHDPVTNARCTAMMIRPCKTRDSTWPRRYRLQYVTGGQVLH
jgi:hypothetical protein